jgi:hypothetical protein
MMTSNKITLNELFEQSSTRLDKIFSHYLNDVPSDEIKNSIE